MPLDKKEGKIRKWEGKRKEGVEGDKVNFLQGGPKHPYIL